MYKKITISGLICTGKTSLFWGLQEKLIWPTFSASQFFRDYSRTHNLSLEKAEEQSNILTRKIDTRMADMLKSSGNIIVEGWMAGIMADELGGVLRILLTCSDQERIHRFANREQLSLKEAEVRVKQRENNLFKVLNKIYKRLDFLDRKNYNLIIDTTSLSKEETVATVLQKLNRS
ncbi:cytidylate kinase family protein [Candidatus Gottesmanbacteria bacterium]|nr:cytidylate kinase family protein [Candidatus Gottesmanbacteria bacterium]